MGLLDSLFGQKKPDLSPAVPRGSTSPLPPAQTDALGAQPLAGGAIAKPMSFADMAAYAFNKIEDVALAPGEAIAHGIDATKAPLEAASSGIKSGVQTFVVIALLFLAFILWIKI